MILSNSLKFILRMKNEDLVAKCLPKGQTQNHANPCQTFTRHTKLVGVALLRMGFKYSLTRDHDVREFMKQVDPEKLDPGELFVMECSLVELVGNSGLTEVDDYLWRVSSGQTKKQRERIGEFKFIGNATHLSMHCMENQIREL